MLWFVLWKNAQKEALPLRYTQTLSLSLSLSFTSQFSLSIKLGGYDAQVFLTGSCPDGEKCRIGLSPNATLRDMGGLFSITNAYFEATGVEFHGGYVHSLVFSHAFTEL